MLKLLNTSVAKLVGATSAVVFQHICYWMQTQQREIIYRTNKQLSEDLDGIYSPQQIQRAKKKLIEEGLIIVTADKRDAWNRTSHYSLTEKGKELLLSVNGSKERAKSLPDDAQNRSDSTKEMKTNRKQYDFKNRDAENKQAKYERSSNAEVMSNNAIEHNSAMRESFKEGFSNANAVPMPDNIKNLIKGKLKKQDVVEQEYIPTEQECTNTEHEHVIVEQCWEDVVADEMEMMSEEYISDDYYPTDNDYDDCQFAMLSSIEATNQLEQKHSNSQSMTFAELMKTVYNKATTEAQEQMYRMKQEYFLDERSEYQSYEHSEYSY